jgi:hypothetical protein
MTAEEQLREDVREIRKSMATRPELQAVKEDVSEVKGHVMSIRQQLGGCDGDGGLRGRVKSLEVQRELDAARQNGLNLGQSRGLRLGLIAGLMAAGWGLSDVVRMLASYLGG